jgi:hypothetical protein
MKKVLLLLLIAPMIGNSQMLDLPVSGVKVIAEYGVNHTVPYGKIWQLTGSTVKQSSSTSPFENFSSESPRIDNCLEVYGNNQVKFNKNTIYGNSTFPSGTNFYLNDGWCSDATYTFIEYNLTFPENEKNEETTVTLNLPVSEVINIVGGDFFYNQQNGIFVPEGKVLQFVGVVNSTNEGYDFQSNDWANLWIEGANNNQGTFKCEVGFVFSSGTTVYLSDDTWYSSLFSFVMYDLNAQNLAYNSPNQTTPTLYPNPTSSLLALNSDKEYDIEVYDMAGNKVMALSGNNINMAHLSTATYIVKATDKSNNEEMTYKVVKN